MGSDGWHGRFISRNLLGSYGCRGGLKGCTFVCGGL